MKLINLDKRALNNGMTAMRIGVYHKTGVFLPEYDFCNSPSHSANLLKSIRDGIHNYFAVMGRREETSVLAKYTDGMWSASPNDHANKWYHEIAEEMIAAIYTTILYENAMSATAGNPTPMQPMALMTASEFANSWCCAFWWRDPNREQVSNTEPDFFHDTFKAKAQAIERSYGSALAHLNAGGTLNVNVGAFTQYQIEAKETIMAQVASLEDFIDGPDQQLEVPVDFEHNMNNFDPELLSSLEVASEEEMKRLEKNAKSKRMLKGLGSILKIDSKDEGIGMASLNIKPAQLNQPIIEDDMNQQVQLKVNSNGPAINPTYGAQPQMNNQPQPLVDFQGRQILTSASAPIMIQPGTVPQGSRIYQEADEMQRLKYDNMGYPLVSIVAPDNRTMDLDLTGSQTAYRQQLRAMNHQQPVAGMSQMPQNNMMTLSQLQQQQQIQQPVTKSAASDIPGLHMASEAPKPEPINATTTQSNTQVAGLIAGLADQAQTTETPTDPALFDVTLSDGETCKATLFKDATYLPVSIDLLNINFNDATHEVAIAYAAAGDVELLINKESFMKRETHMPYSLDVNKGEFDAKMEPRVLIEEQATLDVRPVQVQVVDEIIEDASMCSVTALVFAKQACEESKTLMYNFECQKIHPSKFLPKDLLKVDDEELELAEQAETGSALLRLEALGLRLQDYPSLYNLVDAHIAKYARELISIRLSKVFPMAESDLPSWFNNAQDVIGFLNDYGLTKEFITYFDKELDHVFTYSLVCQGKDTDNLLSLTRTGSILVQEDLVTELHTGLINAEAFPDLTNTLLRAFEVKSDDSPYLYVVGAEGKTYEVLLGDKAFEALYITDIL